MALCKAPVNNMYFTVHGTVAPCWLTVGAIDRWSPTHSISDIWFGEKYQQIRDNISNDIFKGKCGECKKDVDNGVWPLAKAYDQFTVKEYPSLMELELSNQCNLECVMCSGTLSSGIRKNRDKLPPLPQIYTDEFRQQLREFIPHLEELRFNGGEPFAQKIVLDICEDVAELNPGLKVNIATNGTVYNKRVQKIMDMCNIHINISIDSLLHDRYSEIRINGEIATSYTFKQNYYWMMGDNRHNSLDARYFGYTPEDHIVGKPVFIWMSLDPNGKGLNKIRWDRMFTTVSGDGQPQSYFRYFLFALITYFGISYLVRKRKEKKN